MLTLAALALAPRFLLGFLLVDLMWQGQSRRRMLQLALAAPLGIGISSLVSFVWIWLGLGLQLYVRIETAATLLVFALWTWNRRLSIGPAWAQLKHSWPPRGVGWWACLAAAAIIFAAQFWIVALQNPHGSWDAWVHWNVVSRFVYRGGENWQGTFMRVYDDPGYPFLLAMSNATTWQLLQSDTTRGPMVLAFLSTVALASLLFGLVREFRGLAQACLAAVVLLTQDLLVQNGIAQYADVLAACYFLGSAGMLLLHLRSRNASLAVLAGLTAGLGVWTKHEGMAFAATGVVVWAWLSWRERSLAIWNYVFGAAAPLTVFVLFKVLLAPHNDPVSTLPSMLFALSNPARYPVVLQQVGMAFWRDTAGSGGLLIALAVYGFIIGRTGQRIAGRASLAFLFASQAAAYLLIYAGTPHSYGQAAMIPTSIGRLYVQILPMLLAAVFLWLKSPDELNVADGSSVPGLGGAVFPGG
jgi:hypothetical protein